jgi:hypothetical protein
MWLSKQLKPAGPSADADLGVTTIAGGSAGVVSRGEIRALPVYGPGGCVWQPASGETVLVIKGGTGGEESCVAGTEQKGAPEGMQPGELYLYSSGGASIYLRNDGAVILSGKLKLDGEVMVTGTLSINGCGCNATSNTTSGSAST